MVRSNASAAWQTYRGAPAVGTRLLRTNDVVEGEAHCLSCGESGFPIIVTRRRGELRAFVNVCPHQFLPLDRLGADIVSSDGELLRCSNHQAAFRIGDGAGIEGLGVGTALDPIPILVDDEGWVRIATGRQSQERRS